MKHHLGGFITLVAFRRFPRSGLAGLQDARLEKSKLEQTGMMEFPLRNGVIQASHPKTVTPLQD